MSDERWFDGDTHEKVGKPLGEPRPSRLTYYPEEAQKGNEGSAEALFTTLLATWREEVNPLLIPGLLCRWILISGTGPGDLRGYAKPIEGASPSLVIVEAKVQSQKEPLGVTQGRFREAIQQAIEGLQRTRNYYRSEFSEWGGLESLPTNAILVLAADRWGVPSEAMRKILAEEVSKKYEGHIQVRVVTVNRYRLKSRRLVCVETICSV